MIDETSTFLTWALRHRRDVPRIPTRRVDEGGFAELRLNRGARAAVTRWWQRALDQLG